MILVSGGTGVIGSRLVRGLVDSGARVRVLTLANDPYVSRLHGLDVDIRYGDISDRSTLGGLFDEVDTVFHLAAVVLSYNPAIFQRVNVDGTRNMVQGGAAAGVRHFIYVSSASVVYPKPTPYSLSKRESERIVKSQSAMEFTIVRPTLVYSKNGGEEFQLFRSYLSKFPVVPFIGAGRALKRPVHVDDLLRGFLAIPGNPVSYGKTYNLSGGEAISIGDLARLLLKADNLHRPLIPVPVPLCRILSSVLARLMKRPPLTWNMIAGVTQDADLSYASAARDLGYEPRGVREGWPECLRQQAPGFEAAPPETSVATE